MGSWNITQAGLKILNLPLEVLNLPNTEVRGHVPWYMAKLSYLNTIVVLWPFGWTPVILFRANTHLFIRMHSAICWGYLGALFRLKDYWMGHCFVYSFVFPSEWNNSKVSLQTLCCHPGIFALVTVNRNMFACSHSWKFRVLRAVNWWKISFGLGNISIPEQYCVLWTALNFALFRLLMNDYLLRQTPPEQACLLKTKCLFWHTLVI